MEDTVVREDQDPLDGSSLSHDAEPRNASKEVGTKAHALRSLTKDPKTYTDIDQQLLGEEAIQVPDVPAGSLQGPSTTSHFAFWSKTDA